ncbi:hypothetical protein A6M21_16610 [Desulfotomaculum copahuensis]|uniref:Short-chain fatty acid transporter n=2 Tax=Desulfotomaculum copahuensis TaxID=1838280 RepID=A0A1B7LIT3_9FIRM|nr:hypothetical protein A6M21_16610 [Desulfotomaculum copahuensis]
MDYQDDEVRPGIIERFSEGFAKIIRLYMPDAFILAVVLTVVTIILALFLTKSSFVDITKQWYDGIWSIINFAFMMILILITGYTLALSPIVMRFIKYLAGLPKNQGQAIIVAALVGAIGSFVNWGLGLILMGLVSKEIAKRLDVDFPFIIAAAYSGFLVWTCGLSSSIAVILTSRGNSVNFVERFTHQVLPLQSTIFAAWNLIPTVILIICLPILFYFIAPKDKRKWCLVDKETLIRADEEAGAAKIDQVPAAKLDNSWIITIIIVGIGLTYLISIWLKKGFLLDFNTLVFLFLLAGFLLHWRPMNYVNAFYTAARTSGPLALQYPFYGGMMGIMITSGLASVIANFFVHFSSANTLPFWQFIVSLIINLFVPSGGGHWAVQGPITALAAVKLHASQPLSAMAVAWGESTMEMLQPFWMLPVLAIAGREVREVLGYGLAAFILGVVVFGATTLIMAPVLIH